ncbi:MAG: Zn-dependent protease [Rhodocyclales bacterium]|nr:Zn-dependent protease [Rhodocyclales bacterium]
MPDTVIPHEQALHHALQFSDWAAIRYSSETATHRAVRNDKPESNESSLEEGAMCEVLVDGHFGYAATADLSLSGLQRAFDRAITTTRATSQHKVHSFTPGQRPRTTGVYRSARRRDLDALSVVEITDCLMAASRAMSLSDRLVNRSARAMLVQTQIDYFSSNGSETRQSFDMLDITLAATAAEGLESQTRSWSRTGQFGSEAFDRAAFRENAERVAREALDLLAADNCPSGHMDLVLMPDQMMLQIHESIGHPLELDRILGDERNYAGWSFVKQEDFGRLQYGSSLMNVAFDPGRAHELASYDFDDGGNRATREMLIENGVLRRGLGSLESQVRSGLPGVANFRSASWNRAPIDRMANINLEPGTSSLDELIAQVEHGVLMRTNRSWSIDDYRNKFQFGCEHGQLIENGVLGKLVRNPNYRGVTVDFWNRLAGVGSAAETHGTSFCGKGEPSQIIRVGHASPPCLFRDVDVFGGQS